METQQEAIVSNLGSLGPRLRAARRERGLSQEAIAKPYFTKSYISAVERSKVRPSLKALEIIARRLEIPVHELLAQAAADAAESDINGLAEELSFQLDEARWLTDAAHAQEALRLINEAENTYRERFEEFESDTQYRFFAARARAYLRLGEPGSAREDLEKALHLAEQLENGAEEVESVRNLIGWTYFEQGVPRRSLNFHEQGLKAIQEGVVMNPSLKLSIYANLAADYTALGDASQAEGVYAEALALLQDTNNLDRQAAIYRDLGRSFKDNGLLAQARTYGSQALAIQEASRNLKSAAQMRINLAEIAKARGDYQQAEESLRQAAEMLGSKEDGLSWSALYEQFANLDLRLGRIDQAAEHAGESLALAAAAFAKRGEVDLQAQAQAARTFARALRTAGLVEEAQSRQEEADRLLLQALGALEEAGYSDTVSEIEFDYAELLAARGDHASAGAHYRAAYQQRQQRR